MTPPKTPLFLSLLTAAWVTTVWAAEPPAQPAPPATQMNVPSTIQLDGELLSQRPYPYQAARVRLRLCNRSTTTLENVTFTYVAPPKVAGPQKGQSWPAKQPLLVHDLRKPPDANAFDELARCPLSLGIGEAVQLSMTLAADWKADDRSDPKPLFPVAGPYTLTFEHLQVRTSIRVDVRDPVGDESAACARVMADKSLALLLMSPVHVADPVGAEKLGAFVAQFGDTSYGNYARFALARWHLKGVGYNFAAWRSNGWDDPQRAIRGGVREYVSAIRHSPDVEARLIETYLSGWGSAENWRPVLAPAVKRLANPAENDLDSVVDLLVEIIYVSDQDRASALKVLRGVRSLGFAYQPEVEVLRAIAATSGRGVANFINADAHAEYFADALIWLKVAAETATPDEWRARRVIGAKR